MATIVHGDPGRVYLQSDRKGRIYIKGLEKTRQALLAMGLERREFERWMKDAANMAAAEARRTGPIDTAKLISTIKGQASKKMTFKTNGGFLGMQRVSVSRMIYGGVVLAGTEYARATSLGVYHRAGEHSKVGNRVWRTTVRGRGNPYMVRARERMKPRMVDLLNNRIRYFARKKGIETT